jgi:abhydrolase domain-containing protein 12
MFLQVLEGVLVAIGSILALYSALLDLLTISWFQTHVVYLHAIKMTRIEDLDVPEIFGFLHNQVTPFGIKSASGGILYAWHILPVELYRQHEQKLLHNHLASRQTSPLSWPSNCSATTPRRYLLFTSMELVVP